MLQWTEEELRAMREADAEIDAQRDDLYPGLSRTVDSLVTAGTDGKRDNRAYKRAYYQKNKDRLKAKRDALSPEERSAYNKAYYQKNRERILEQARIRWKTDPEYRAANSRRNQKWLAKADKETLELMKARHRERQKVYQAAYRKRIKERMAVDPEFREMVLARRRDIDRRYYQRRKEREAMKNGSE